MAGKVSIIVEFRVHNQDDEFITSLSDYILLLLSSLFIRHSTQEDKTHKLLEF